MNREKIDYYGYEFKSDGDTEVILAAWKVWGEDMLLRFNGMWSFALWDIHKQELVMRTIKVVIFGTGAR